MYFTAVDVYKEKQVYLCGIINQHLPIATINDNVLNLMC